MIQLENGHFSLTLDENGHLAEMSNLDSKRVLTLPHALLRLIIGDAQCLELEAVPSGIPEIQKTDDTVTLRYPAIDCDQRGRLEVGVEMRIHLAEDEIQWEISLDNRTADATVREVHYPVLALRDPNSPMAAVTSNKVSERIYDLPKQIQSCFTEYMAPDQKYIRYSTLYPDRFNAMNCFLLDWGADGFYVGCHDETFELTGHVFELEKNTSLNMTMVRYPFLKPGAGWQENKIRTAPYCGGWMTGAKNTARGRTPGSVRRSFRRRLPVQADGNGLFCTISTENTFSPTTSWSRRMTKPRKPGFTRFSCSAGRPKAWIPAIRFTRRTPRKAGLRN